MKIPKSSEDLIQEIFLCVDLTEKLGDLRIRQLMRLLPKVSDEIILKSVIKVFSNKDRNETLYLDQLYAGKILTNVNPKSQLDIKSILDEILENWNKSIRDMPLWLFNNYKKEDLNNALLSIINDPFESNEKRDKAETMIWWIKSM
ncbi:hypothetical protein C8C83_0873 [Flavobacterium sp. 90]|uniref:hypothetical protein n=1 Tax=unclassified Flavobacterium TaxID=196869 RepID=UPI000EB34699|nr:MULTISPECIES: hypothetical protein [unclassified Flavobacterium]RKR09254.1 hypothetical protein C8C82_1173 [Flavobacterium sp. 81]TCK53037.1 hypothetical protein C8C83_0873 [Flavobacterium sp. 90]